MAPRTPDDLREDGAKPLIPGLQKPLQHSADAFETSARRLGRPNTQELAHSASSSLDKSHAAQSGEALKRRRLGYDSTQPLQTQTGLSSDAVKALFNIGSPHSATNHGQYGNKPSMFASTLFGRLDAFQSFAQSYTYPHEALVSDNTLPRASASGLVPGTPTHNSHASLNGYLGDLSAADSPGNIGGVPLGNMDLNVPSPAQPNGFQLPGLGAAQTSREPLGAPAPREVEHSLADSRFIGPGPSAAGHDTHLSNGVPGPVPRNESQAHHQQGPSASDFQQQISHVDETSAHAADTRLKSSHQDQIEGPTSPHTPHSKKMESSASKGHASEDGTTPSTPKPVYPDGPPPVWMEKQVPRTFKMQRVIHDRRQESFEKAFDILGTMNPDHYQMTYGSKVVCIKCANIDNILLSMRVGFWTTNPNVMKRIMGLHNKRANDDEKTLLFWSIPGSKNFVGLAELHGYNDNIIIDFKHQDNEVIKGALIIRWIYCKLVGYDDVRQVEGQDEASITQMWNGMHYSDKTGRDVIQAYVEAPHIENLLVRPRGEFFRRAMANSRFAPVARHYPVTRGPPRSQHHSRPFVGNTRKNVRTEHAKSNRASEPVAKAAVKATVKTETNNSTNVNSASPEQKGPVAEPKLQLMPVLVHADGTIIPAPHMQSSLTTLDPVQSSNGLPGSGAQNINAQRPDAQRPDAQRSRSTLDQTHSISSMQSSNRLAAPPMHTPLTLSSAFPSHEVMGQRKTSSVFDEGKAKMSNDMPPPPRPPVPQGPHRLSAPFADTRPSMNVPRSSPSANRFMHNINTWTYNGGNQDAVQPQTPMGRAYHSSYNLSGSPGQKDHTTPRPVYPVGGQGFGDLQRMQSQEPLSGQFGTPFSSPVSVKMQSPGKQDTTRPFGHRNRNNEAFSSHELRTNFWIERLVKTPANDPEKH